MQPRLGRLAAGVVHFWLNRLLRGKAAGDSLAQIDIQYHTE
jgi:hypothetical protein